MTTTAAAPTTAATTVAGATETPLPGRPARRLQPPSWRDPRMVVGLLLVVGSVVAGGLVVRTADDTVPVYAARHTLVPGQRLAAEDVTVVRARLDPGLDRYLAAEGPPEEGRVVLRTVGAGELVARSAVGERAEVDLRPVAVPLDPSAVRRLGPGVLVDVWVSLRRDGASDGFAEPRRIASSVEVAATTSEHGALGSSTSSAAHLLLGPDLVPEVIAAVDNEARITLVPVPATVLDDGS
ncbi:SAF domain-containing protein [Angustibacter luteus]|uniref:SAF domain-containing protein n=1 Tax=Angustibacter luteus TaxID=658456 RepID=A0ABW1JFX6_9ACTN